MILWTIQPARLYSQIMKDGYYHFDEKKDINHDACKYEYPEAYDWLAAEMIKRVGEPHVGVKYPVWAWYIHDSKRKKPDLRKAEYGKKGQKMVCLEIDIPDNEVVLSDEEDWIFVMSNWYLSDTYCEEDLNKDNSWFESLPEDKKHKAMVDSWQNIFEITPFENEFTAKGRFVQATFWELKAEQIRKVQFFTAR